MHIFIRFESHLAVVEKFVGAVKRFIQWCVVAFVCNALADYVYGPEEGAAEIFNTDRDFGTVNDFEVDERIAIAEAEVVHYGAV